MPHELEPSRTSMSRSRSRTFKMSRPRPRPRSPVRQCPRSSPRLTSQAHAQHQTTEEKVDVVGDSQGSDPRRWSGGQSVTRTTSAVRPFERNNGLVESSRVVAYDGQAHLADPRYHNAQDEGNANDARYQLLRDLNEQRKSNSRRRKSGESSARDSQCQLIREAQRSLESEHNNAQQRKVSLSSGRGRGRGRAAGTGTRLVRDSSWDSVVEGLGVLRRRMSEAKHLEPEEGDFGDVGTNSHTRANSLASHRFERSESDWGHVSPPREPMGAGENPDAQQQGLLVGAQSGLLDGGDARARELSSSERAHRRRSIRMRDPSNGTSARSQVLRTGTQVAPDPRDPLLAPSRYASLSQQDPRVPRARPQIINPGSNGLQAVPEITQNSSRDVMHAHTVQRPALARVPTPHFSSPAALPPRRREHWRTAALPTHRDRVPRSRQRWGSQASIESPSEGVDGRYMLQSRETCRVSGERDALVEKEFVDLARGHRDHADGTAARARLRRPLSLLRSLRSSLSATLNRSNRTHTLPHTESDSTDSTHILNVEENETQGDASSDIVQRK